jgi:hypothetical protein
MNERRNVPEIVIAICELLRRSQTRINLLFTMSEIPHPHPVGRKVRSDVSRTMFGDRACRVLPRPAFALTGLRRGSLRYDRACRAEAGKAREGWWSQTGSNRRPHACKARALPAELWPQSLRTAPVVAPRAMPGTLHLLARVAAPRVANGEAWWAWEDLNFRPHAYQARALTN